MGGHNNPTDGPAERPRDYLSFTTVKTWRPPWSSRVSRGVREKGNLLYAPKIRVERVRGRNADHGIVTRSRVGPGSRRFWSRPQFLRRIGTQQRQSEFFWREPQLRPARRKPLLRRTELREPARIRSTARVLEWPELLQSRLHRPALVRARISRI